MTYIFSWLLFVDVENLSWGIIHFKLKMRWRVILFYQSLVTVAQSIQTRVCSWVTVPGHTDTKGTPCLKPCVIQHTTKWNASMSEPSFFLFGKCFHCCTKKKYKKKENSLQQCSHHCSVKKNKSSKMSTSKQRHSTSVFAFRKQLL